MFNIYQTRKASEPQPPYPTKPPSLKSKEWRDEMASRAEARHMDWISGKHPLVDSQSDHNPQLHKFRERHPEKEIDKGRSGGHISPTRYVPERERVAAAAAANAVRIESDFLDVDAMTTWNLRPRVKPQELGDSMRFNYSSEAERVDASVSRNAPLDTHGHIVKRPPTFSHTSDNPDDGFFRSMHCPRATFEPIRVSPEKFRDHSDPFVRSRQHDKELFGEFQSTTQTGRNFSGPSKDGTVRRSLSAGPASHRAPPSPSKMYLQSARFYANGGFPTASSVLPDDSERKKELATQALRSYRILS